MGVTHFSLVTGGAIMRKGWNAIHCCELLNLVPILRSVLKKHISSLPSSSRQLHIGYIVCYKRAQI